MPHADMIEAADVERRFAITSSEIPPKTWRMMRFTLEGVDGPGRRSGYGNSPYGMTALGVCLDR